MKKKILSIIGARPQFIKAAPFSAAIRKRAEEVIVHTGQHYDGNMSQVFFRDMGIPEPAYDLAAGSGTHGKQTGNMLIRIEEVLLKEKPDYVVVFGDTNSTIAGALSAVKLHIPVGHIEAGLRSFNRKMPEEINRVLTDTVSSQLFCPTDHAVSLLANEGVTREVYNTGDIMYDAMRHFLPLAEDRTSLFDTLGIKAGQYYLFTMHRPENTDDARRVKAIFTGLKACGGTIVYPVHPRMHKVLKDTEIAETLKDIPQLRMIDPLGYLDMIALESAAKKIITDSGGIQKEAFFLKRPCITIRNESEWVETVEAGYNILTGADPERLSRAIRTFAPDHEPASCFGDGHAAEHIAEKILQYLNDRE